MSTSRPSDVTRLLLDLSSGRREATDELLPLVYAELRDLAARLLRQRTPRPHPAAHRPGPRGVPPPGGPARRHLGEPGHFLGIAAQAMRRILVDHARRRSTAKRRGARVTLDEELSPATGPSVDLLEIDAALERLTALDERQARVVELRFFGGLSVEETAAALGIGTATVKRDWTLARAWLHRELAAGRG